MGLLGDGWDDPRSAAMMALAGGLLKRDFGGGLLGANDAYGQAKQNAFKQQLAQLQMQEAQQKMQDAQAARQWRSNLPDPTAQGMQLNPLQQTLYQGAKAGGLPVETYLQSLQKDETPISVAAGGSLVDRRTMKPMFTAPKEQSLPSAIQEYQFAQGQGYRGTFEQWDRDRKRAGATNVSVGVNTDKSYFGNVAEGLAKVDVGAIDAGRSAPDRIASSRRVREVLATNPITGTGAEARLSLNKALATAGLIDGTNVANTEVLASTLASQTLDAIKTSGLGAGQGFTDKDRQFLERAKSGNIEMTPQALGILADLNERAALASIRRANSVIGKLRQSPQAGAMGQALDPIPEPSAPSVVRKPPGAAPKGGVRFLGFE